jgi:hypothetical protein
MTTATATATKTTEYTVTFHWVADDWTEDDINENGDAPTTSSDDVIVTLPTGATPWQVYQEADALAVCPSSAGNDYGWDADGMTISFDDKTLSLAGYQIQSDTQWSDFY